MQEGPVPNLDAVAPVPRQLPQELIQDLDELPSALEVARGKVRELKEQHPKVRLKRLARAEERRGKEAGIEEILIGCAGAPAKPRQVGVVLDGDAVGHLEREPEIRGHLAGKPFEEMLIGKLVVSGINADRLEHLRIFRQAKPLESGLREPAVPDVTVVGVELPEPAGYFQDEVPMNTPSRASRAAVAFIWSRSKLIAAERSKR